MGNGDLPVFRRGVHEYTVPELVSILSEGVSQEKVCKTKPVSVEHNCTFVVALSCVRDPSDLRADDSGVWRHRGVRKTWVVTDETGKIISQNRERPPRQLDVPIHGHLYILSRVYHILQSSPDFKRMIVTLQGENVLKKHYPVH